MNSQQGRVSTNGYNRGRVDTVTGSRMENNMQSRKSASPNFAGRITTPSRDRLIYVLSLLIGRHVEVHVKNGSIISGIFHATNADRDFEIVLKMAQVVKDGSVREQKSFRDSITSSRLMIVPARELVQLLAKDVSLDEFTSGHSNEKGKDLLIDSVISHSHLDTERELMPWIPDEDDPECPELENIFDGTLDRKWDQFETNAALFGVKSTFNEELYTTKLERGPQMKELEKEASRIAREIEGQEAHDFHQAEERGFNFHDDLGLDEESRYSAVRRESNDTRFRETENTYNSEIFSGSAGGVTSRSSPVPSSTNVSNEVQAIQNETLASSKSSSLDEDKYLHADKDSGLYPSSHDSHQASDCITQSSPPLDGESRFALNQLKDQSGKTENTAQESRASEGESEGLTTNGTLCSPSASSQGDLITEPSDSQVLVDVSTTIKSVSYRTRQGSSPNNVSADTSNRLSVSPRSCGSLSSEKSTLNPNAKEFKLNPNAKSFTPSTSERPHAEVSDGPFYYPNNVASFQHMHGLPVGMGAAPFGHHPVFYNPHAPPMQSSQAYIHPNGSMYGQQMIVGQPPQFYYVQGYPPEMPHKGRKY